MLRPDSRRPPSDPRIDPGNGARRPGVVSRMGLDRRFEAVVFDWDGTAVPDRDADASELRVLIESLCAAGMHLAVITGTHVGNVDEQLRARPKGPGRLLFAVNRGSELFDVGPEGPVLVARRVATGAEELALDRAAVLATERFRERGLLTEVVSQRLNRRKIDLIPLAEWRDPPKARIDELVIAVEHRLAEAGLDGLPEAVAVALEAARDAGLTDPKVTSDAKHVEIGLTDKADASRAVFEVLWDEGIDPEQVLVAGDEFGPLGGVPGSDSLMVGPEARGAAVVSVGVEPNGVPAGVRHLGGGPGAFRELLDDQLRVRGAGSVPDVVECAGWSLRVDGIDHERERAVETLFTLADGTIGTSGAPLLSSPSANPGVVVGGVYRGDDAKADLLDAPRWERLGRSLFESDAVSRVLDLHSGTLAESITDDADLRSVRFVSMARPGTAALRVDASPAVAAGPALVVPGETFDPVSRPRGEPETTALCGKARGVAAAAVQTRRGGTLDRIATYGDFDGFDGTAATEDVLERLAEARAAGFDVLLTEHRRAWGRRWAGADIAIPNDSDLQLAVRFALFHLMGAVGDSGDAAVGARGLSGHGYRGHVFWDSDVFVLPFLAATHPASARAMVEYRLRRMEAAFAAARSERRSGARFPWESATFGDDVTPRSVRDRSGELVPIRTGTGEVHIVADVAWAACCYVDWSGDAGFASGGGHALLVETARYWASRIRVLRDGAHIFGVIGPDEYHEPVDDNMFTNVMARWNLRRAAASAARYGGVEDAERRRWLDLADAMVDGYDEGSGRHEQFAGFRDLEPLIIAELAPRRPVVADMLLGRERVTGAQVVKQPDVLMAHHLVEEECMPGSLGPDLDFYEPRTAHGSSLSPGVMAALFARERRYDEAMHWLRIAAEVDLRDVTNTTAGGLHLATMGSVWQALVWGFAGLRATPETLVVDPRVPGGWDGFEVRVRYHDVPVRVAFARNRATIIAAAPLTVRAGPDGEPLVCGPDPVVVPCD